MTTHDLRDPGPRDLRRFALTVGTAFLALAVASYLRGHRAAPAVLGAGGAALLLGGLLVPGRLGGVYRGWMRLALAISRVTTPLFMGIVYFAILTPLALVRRRGGRGRLGVAPGARTGWVDRPAGARRSDLRRQF